MPVKLSVYAYYTAAGERTYVDDNDYVQTGAWSGSITYVAERDAVLVSSTQYMAIITHAGTHPEAPPGRNQPKKWSPLVKLYEKEVEGGGGNGGGGGGNGGSGTLAEGIIDLIENTWELAQTGTNIAWAAWDLAQTGTNIAWDAWELAQTGTEIAWAAWEMAQDGTNACKLAEKAWVLAQYGTNTGTAAYDLAADALARANQALVIATAGTSAGGAYNLAQDAYELAEDAYNLAVTGTATASAAYALAQVGTNNDALFLPRTEAAATYALITDSRFHVHANKPALDKITEAGGFPLWQGSAWPSSGTGAQGPVGPAGPEGPQGIQGPAGPMGLFNFEFTFSTSALPPGTNEIRLNNGQVLATAIAISKIDLTGLDITAALLKLHAGSLIRIQTWTNTVEWQRYVSTGTPVDNGSYVTIPVSFSAGGNAVSAGRTSLYFSEGGQTEIDHGSLLGLADNDHPQYLLATSGASIQSVATAAWTLAQVGTNTGTAAYNLATSANQTAIVAYSLAVSGTNAAASAQSTASAAWTLAQTGTNAAASAQSTASVAYSLAVSGTNSAATALATANSARTTAQVGTNTGTAAYNLATSANQTATAAYPLAVSGTNAAATAQSVANAAYAMAQIGTDPGTLVLEGLWLQAEDLTYHRMTFARSGTYYVLKIHQ